MGCDASQYQSTPPDSLPLGHEVCAVSSDVVLMSTPVVTGLTIVDVQEGFKDVSVADDRPYNRTLDGSIPEKQQINESETVGDQYVWVSKQVSASQFSVEVVKVTPVSITVSMMQTHSYWYSCKTMSG